MTLRILLFSICLAAAAAPPAVACAACACGDNTLTTLGTGQSFAGRVRLFTSVELRSERYPDVGRFSPGTIGFDERVAVAVTPVDGFTLTLSGGLGQRRTQTVGPVLYTLGPLDTSLEARYEVLTARWAGLWHRASVTGAVSAPPALHPRDKKGRPLALGADPSLGAHRAALGGLYVGGRAPLSVFASGRVEAGALAEDGRVFGPAVHGSGLVAFQPRSDVAVMGGAEGRVEAHAPNLLRDRSVLVTATVVLAWSVWTDVLVTLTSRAPVWEADDRLRSGPSLTAGVVLDL